MKLIDYVKAIPTRSRERFAAECGTTAGHINNVMYGYRSCSPELAVAIERVSGGAVRRHGLVGNWRDIWPELAETVGD